MLSPVIQISSLTRRFDGTKAVDQLSLEVVRESYFRVDRSEAVFVLECQIVDEAREALFLSVESHFSTSTIPMLTGRVTTPLSLTC
jgi:hypothetical protein